MIYLFNNIKNKDILDAYLNLAIDDSDEAMDIFTSKIVNLAIEKGFRGNIWKKYIIYTLIYNANPYTLAIERGSKVTGFTSLVDNDLNYFYDLYTNYGKYFAAGEIVNFKLSVNNRLPYLNSCIDEIINEIDTFKTYDDFKHAIINFYLNHGVGEMALNKAFRVEDGVLSPIYNVLNVTFDDIIGYDPQKALLRENTEAFLAGKTYNNVLLFGDSGTGKSTSIKALLNEYFESGLRIIEVYKHQMEEISKIIDKLKNRPYSYIIYMDDLSFEAEEAEYKYLKSIIEGGIEPKPNNVAIYATSNRRHLIKEVVADNGTIMDDLNRNETQAEKLSLAYRFGLQLYYSSLSPKQFRAMVIELARKNDIVMNEEELLSEASKFELKYGSLSGRCATQFINYIGNKIKN